MALGLTPAAYRSGFDCRARHKYGNSVLVRGCVRFVELMDQTISALEVKKCAI